MTATRDRLLVVLGHRRPGPRGRRPWPISAHCLERVRHAERLAGDPRVAAVLFCGFGAPGRPSEAAQMHAAWAGPTAPLLLDEQSARTADNALAALGLARSLPAVREIVVVTSAWHLRARLYFAQLRHEGYRIAFRGAWGRRALGRYLLYELALLGEVPAQRRRIRAAVIASEPAPAPSRGPSA